jgi:coenzyme F420-reducing hydrogenase beta subunit
MKQFSLFDSKEFCCGCGACKSACPVDAIHMEYDEYGCCYPAINSDACIDCKKCIKACNFRKHDVEISAKGAYVALSSDTDLKKSTSGGVFAGLAKQVLEKGGYVYGCSMETEEGVLTPKHICVSNIQDLYRISGSKYVQSDTGYIYRDVKEKLNKGKTVLFSGTPCQISGLYGYLQQEYENLYTVDVVCHGTPGFGFFKDYIANLENKYHIKITEFSFRDNFFPFSLGTGIQYVKKNKSTVRKHLKRECCSYHKLFSWAISCRESCYSCPYAGERRPANITLGDFWGIKEAHPNILKENGGTIKAEDGISCMIINDNRGKELLENFGSKIYRWESTFDDIAKKNASLRHPRIRNPKRDDVFKLYMSGGYKKVEKWYIKKMAPFLIGQFCWGYVPKKIKIILLKIINK